MENNRFSKETVLYNIIPDNLDRKKAALANKFSQTGNNFTPNKSYMSLQRFLAGGKFSNRKFHSNQNERA